MLEKIARLNKRKLAVKTIESKTLTEPTESASSFKDIFGTRTLALRSFALMCIWCSTLMCYVGLIIGSSNLMGNVYKDFALVSVMEFPGILLAVVACEKIGRKKSTLGSLAFGGISCLVIPLISREGSGGIVRLILGTIGRLAIGINYHSMVVWSNELYPTTARSTAMGMMTTAARVGAASSPWIVKGLGSLGDWIPFTFMGLSALLGAIAGLKLRETNNEQLTEKREWSEKPLESVELFQDF